MAFERFEQFWDPLIQATLQNPFYLKYGLVVVFLYGLTPNTIFIPNVSFWSPLYFDAIDKENFLVMIITLTTISGFIGDTLIYFGAKHGFKFFIKNFKKKDEIRASHAFHKYHRLVFIFSPTIPILSEGALIFAAYSKLRYMKFAPFLLLGNTIKNIVEVTVFLTLMVGVGMI